MTYLRLSVLTFLTLAISSCLLAEEPSISELPSDPSFWKQLDTLPPTPKGKGYLPGIESGKFLQFRYPVPKEKPSAYLINIDNIVAMHGGGTWYQVEIHIDSPTGPLLYKSPKIFNDYAFNADNHSHLNATKFLTPTHIQQGYLDVWATVWVEGDKWTTYRDTNKGRWDMYALIPAPEAFARWQEARRKREEMLNRGLFLLPWPQQIDLRPNDFRFRSGLSVTLIGSTSKENRATAELVCGTSAQISGLDIPLANGSERNQIRLVIAKGQTLQELVGFRIERDIGDQGYVLDVKPDVVIVAAHTPVGLYYGAQTLLQLLKKTDNGTAIKGASIVDWPDLKYRMVQYDIARGNTVNVEYWKRWIRELSRLKVNQIMLYMEDDFKFRKYPFLGRPNTFTWEKAKELVAYSRKHHIELVPQLESLGHADALLSHDELKDLRLAGRRWAICPLAKRTFTVLDDMFGELCTAFNQSSLFHVGADEVWGFGSDPRCADMVKERGEEGVYAFHLNTLQKLLAKRGRKMAFWGDEVLHHPKVADSLTRDAVVFDWHYGNQKAYPSIKFFQDHGFKEIYVCPAVHGYFDVYPQYRQAFGNIAGFTRAGVEHGVEGVCCTTWGMNRGGNAENYLYGLAYAAECGWSSRETDRAFFDDRFAAVWLGIPDAKGIRTDIDRAFWFTWRGPERHPFWQQVFKVSRLFFSLYEGFDEKMDDASRARLLQQAKELEKLCGEAFDAIKRLRAKASRNLATLSALEHAVRVHRHVAKKCIAMIELADQYRRAYSAKHHDSRELSSILNIAMTRLKELQDEYPTLEHGFKEGIENRDGDPNDLLMLNRARKSLDHYIRKIRQAQEQISNGNPPPDPGKLRLGWQLSAKIFQWHTNHINPSDREHPRKIIIEVTKWLTSRGPYEVEWDYTRGQDGLDITSTGLYWSSSKGKEPQDLKPLVVDEHHAFTGAVDRDNRYKLLVPKLDKARRYFVVGIVYNQRNFDTNGDVWLRRAWDKD